MDPVEIIRVSYLKISPDVLIRDLDPRSAFTISVPRISSMPVEKVMITLVMTEILK